MIVLGFLTIKCYTSINNKLTTIAMCALLVLLFLGPRAALIFFWLFQTTRFNAAFDTIAWPILGILFLPWTTIMYLIVYKGGIVDWEWFFMILAFIADIASYGGGYRSRGSMPY